jgi:hypothetical protein
MAGLSETRMPIGVGRGFRHVPVEIRRAIITGPPSATSGLAMVQSAAWPSSPSSQQLTRLAVTLIRTRPGVSAPCSNQ